MLDLTTTNLRSVSDTMRNALKRRWPNAKMAANQVFIPCVFHGEKTPSLSINTNPDFEHFGHYFCFGCGEHGFWDAFARQAGGVSKDLDSLSLSELERWLSIQPLRKRPDPYEIESLEQYMRDNALPCTPWDTCSLDWRGFTAEEMRFLGAHAVFNWSPESKRKELMALFPVTVLDQLRGAVRCGIDSKLYLNMAGDWRTDYGLLFYDHAVKANAHFDTPFMVICEGVRDAARLVCAGIPAIALLGTQGWNQTKTELLQIATPHADVSRFYMATDPDAAGRAAAVKITQSMNDCMLDDITQIDLPTNYKDADGNTIKADIFQLTDKHFSRLLRNLHDENGWDGVPIR